MEQNSYKNYYLVSLLDNLQRDSLRFRMAQKKKKNNFIPKVETNSKQSECWEKKNMFKFINIKSDWRM